MFKNIFFRKKDKIKENWVFFKLKKNDKISLIRINDGIKNITPINSYKNILVFSICFLNPLKSGFSSGEEFEKICEIENVLVEKISKKIESIFVSAIKYDGKLNLYFYLKKVDYIDKIINETMLQFDEYKYYFYIELDKKWKKYLSIFDGKFE